MPAVGGDAQRLSERHDPRTRNMIAAGVISLHKGSCSVEGLRQTEPLTGSYWKRSGRVWYEISIQMQPAELRGCRSEIVLPEVIIDRDEMSRIAFIYLDCVSRKSDV